MKTVTESPSDALQDEQVQFYRLACYGALSKELRHEANNLLAVAGAWAGYRTTWELTSLTPLLDKSADAVARLAMLERAIGLCAMHKNGLQRDEPFSEILSYTATILAPRLRIAGVELTRDSVTHKVPGSTGPWVLALVLVLRHIIEEVAAAGGQHMALTTDVVANGSGSTLQVTMTGEGMKIDVRKIFRTAPVASDTPEFWSGPGLAVARFGAQERHGDLIADVRAGHYVMRLPLVSTKPRQGLRSDGQ